MGSLPASAGELISGPFGGWQCVSMQQSFFGVPSARNLAVSVFHDESGTDQAHDRYQLHGALFVPTSRIEETARILASHRGGFRERLHFARLKDHPSDPKPAVAASWLAAYFSELTDMCPYKCMIVDTASQGFDWSRYPRACDLYNLGAALAVFGGITWSFKAYDRLDLQVYSEQADRAADDPFAEQVPRDVARRSANKARFRGGGTPLVNVPVHPVVSVPSDRAQLPPGLEPHWELIQLTDLLTSAVRQAVVTSSSLQVKLCFADLLADYITDTQFPPWLQRKDIYRRFSVSCFPDAGGGFHDVQLAITQINQPRLMP